MPFGQVMHKFKEGKLHSGSKKGPKVTSRSQAVAIMISEKKKGSKYHAYGSGPFTQADIKKGFKICYNANDLEKLKGRDEKVTGKMAVRRKPVTRQGSEY